MHRALLLQALVEAAQQGGGTAAAPAAREATLPTPPPTSLPPPGSRPTAQLYLAIILVALMAAATVALAVGCRTLRFALRLERGEVRLLPDPRAPPAPPPAQRARSGAPPPNPAAARRRRTPQSVVDGIPLATFSEMGARDGGGAKAAEAADAAAAAAAAERAEPPPALACSRGQHVSLCVICLAEFAPADAVRVLPCGHYEFHQACVDEWLTRRDDCCPLCKVSVGATNATTTAGTGGGAGREGAAIGGAADAPSRD